MDSSKTNFMSLFQQYVYKSRYARFLQEEGRREEWNETIDRYFDFFQTHLKERCNYNLTKELRAELSNSVLNFKVMPSMRAIMTAGEALRSSEIASYNCSYVAIDTPKAFSEILFILMNGVGVGFSVERQYVNKLPTIPELFPTDTIISVADSRIGWAKALSELISILYAGSIPKWDVSKLRPSGAILKTFGGRSSGPDPLVKTFNFIVETFKEAQERKLTSIECHDIICSIADCVIVGGVRRCLPHDTNIHSDKGIVKISDIKIGDKVFTGKGYQSVIAKENTGFQNLWKIETQLGDYYSTGNHRWAILTDQQEIEWKETRYLTSNDVLVSYNNVIEGKQTSLPPFNYIKPNSHSTTCKNINIPVLDPETSWFFGQLHGDGYVALKANRGSVSIACADNVPDQEKRVIECFRKFDVNVYMPPTYENCSKPRANSKQLAQYLYQFKQPNTSINIPSFITEGTVDIRAAYIAGLFDADGYFPIDTTQKAYIVVSTVYPKFAEQIRDLLSTIGIFSKVKIGRKSSDRWQTIYNVQLFGNESVEQWNLLVAPYSSKHKLHGNNQPIVEQRSFVVPFQEKSQSFKLWQKENNTHFNWRPVKITKVIETDIIEETYDIEVENEHCFVIGGGLLTHNSALISLSNLSDDRMRSAKSGQWWTITPWRTLANNSAVYVDKRPSMETFMNEWKSLYDSKSGERGIFSRYATKNVVERSNNFRKKHFGDDARVRNTNYEFGVNPCCVSHDTILDVFIDNKYQKITIKDLSDYVKDNPRSIIKVKAWNFETQEIEYNEISFIGVTRKNAELLKITDSNTRKTIKITPDHLVWTENRGWIQAGQLESEDTLKIINSIKRENNIVSIEPISKHEDTYDITNPINHNFFADDILVHNSEIVLRDKQLCNLSEVVIREDDTIETLKEKIRHATILGTFQSTLTNFKFVSNKWKTNTEDERLLGVSLTGIMDNPLTSGSQGFDKLKHLLTELRKTAIETNIKYAKKLGIEPSTAITAIKPSGTVSSLVDSASGIHTRHSSYYLRTARSDNKDPLAQLMIDSGIYYEKDVTKPDHGYVFTFPTKSPSHAKFRNDLTAIEQLEIWLFYQKYYCEHKPSVTISVREEEWMEVGAWVYKNFEWMSGVSFLPYNDHVYEQAPYQEITEQQYNEWMAKTPIEIDWEKLKQYEQSDLTVGAQTLACAAGGCDI